MGKYKVITGQNIFDVALAIYGSLEGLTDLLMNNDKLSLCDGLKMGDELIYSDNFVLNNDVLAYNRSHNLVPANGERYVYFKEATLPAMAQISVSNEETVIALSMNGSGKMEIDWGDNCPLETFELSNKQIDISHSFNSAIAKRRKISIYGNPALTVLNLTSLRPTSIILLVRLYVEQFMLSNCELRLDFVPLLENTHTIDMSQIKCESLIPLVSQKSLMHLNLSHIRTNQNNLDDYFIELVRHYSNRRSCTIYMTSKPSGEYNEPKRDQNNKYMINTGMEAIWVLTNEPTWNEGGFWKIIINDITYTTEP